MQAGFDGVEIHGANGFLIDQFLDHVYNQRVDRFGGDAANRMRFAIEVASRVADSIGAGRVGMRLSPYGAYNGMTCHEDTDDFFEALALQLSSLGLVYLHLVDLSSMGLPEVKPTVKEKIRDSFKGALILSGGYTFERANGDLSQNRGDLVAFGRPFISNPHLVTRLRERLPLAVPHADTFYTPGADGYTDYPLR